MNIEKYKKDALLKIDKMNLIVGNKTILYDFNFLSTTFCKIAWLDDLFTRYSTAMPKKIVRNNVIFHREKSTMESSFLFELNSCLIEKINPLDKSSVKFGSRKHKYGHGSGRWPVSHICTHYFVLKDIDDIKNSIIEAFEFFKLKIENKIPYFKSTIDFANEFGEMKTISLYFFYNGQIFCDGEELPIKSDFCEKMTEKSLINTLSQVKYYLENQRDL